MKSKQPCPGFELETPWPFPTILTIISQVPCINIDKSCCYFRIATYSYLGLQSFNIISCLIDQCSTRYQKILLSLVWKKINLKYTFFWTMLYIYIYIHIYIYIYIYICCMITFLILIKPYSSHECSYLVIMKTSYNWFNRQLFKKAFANTSHMIDVDASHCLLGCRGTMLNNYASLHQFRHCHLLDGAHTTTSTGVNVTNSNEWSLI